MSSCKRGYSTSEEEEDNSPVSDSDLSEPDECDSNSDKDSSESIDGKDESSVQDCDKTQCKIESTEKTTVRSKPDESMNIKIEQTINGEVSTKTVDANSDVKPLKELKKNLRALMKLHSTNSGDFATGGLLPDVELPVIPLIDVKDYGLLPFPLNDTTFNCVKPLCKQSPYGMGEETLVDTSVRNSFQLEPGQFEITNHEFVKQVSVLIQKKIKSALGLAGATIYGKIYKLLIYEKGGKFAEHKDTEKEDNMFGTLIVQLPSVFTGGDLVVNHLKSSKVFDNSSSGSSTHCKFVAHYASCPHELKEVTSGYRAVLVYSLCWEGNGMKPSPYTASTNAVRLCNTLNLLMDSPKIPFLCWGLEYEYSDASLKENSLEFFKGKDSNIVAGLKNALDYDRQISGKDKWEMCVATANKKVSEYGNCDDGYDRYDGWGGGSCCGDHDCDMGENERSYDIDDFVSLTTNSDCKNLSFDINPRKDITNFPNRKILTGLVKRRKENDSDEEFWGTDDLGDGCSGPSGNEGSTRERWYKKKVLLLWRTDCSLAIRCRSSIDDGVSHILSLLEGGKIEDGEKGFQYLWANMIKTKSSEKMLLKILRMCHILKRKEESRTLLTLLKIYGITSDESVKVITETAKLFPDESFIDDIKEIIKSTKESDIPALLMLCKRLPSIEPKVLLQIIVNDILKDTVKQYGDYYYQNRWAPNNPQSPVTTTILEYMFVENLCHESLELDKLISKIVTLKDLVSAVILAIDHQNVNVIDLILMRFIELASQVQYESHNTQIVKQRRSVVDTAIAEIFKAIVSGLQKYEKFAESVSTVVNIISSLPDNQQQKLSGPFVKEILLQYDSNKENVPECLQEIFLPRIKFLEETIRKGEPKFTWHQPEALIAGHSNVMEFLRGPNKSMDFGRRIFKGISDARRWARDHAKEKGCYITLTPSGTGRNAFVTIVKTAEGYDKQVAFYKACVKEYLTLLKFIPNKESVIPKESGQRQSVSQQIPAGKENQMRQKTHSTSSGQLAKVTQLGSLVTQNSTPRRNHVQEAKVITYDVITID